MAPKKEQWDKDAYGLDEAKEIWGNVAGTIDYMDLGFKAKKPDWKKLAALMKKANKPASYYMTLDGLKYTFEVHVGSKRLVLNKVDFGKLRDERKQRDILRKLSLRTKLVTKEELAKFDEQHADAEDGPEAIKINKEIDRLKNELAFMRQTAEAANYRSKTVDKALFMNKEFKAWAARKGYGAFVSFLIDVDDKRGWSSDVVAFLKLGKKTGLRESTLRALLKALKDREQPDFTEARKEVARIVNKVMLPKYNKEKMRELTDEMKAHQAKVRALEKKLVALKAA